MVYDKGTNYSQGIGHFDFEECRNEKQPNQRHFGCGVFRYVYKGNTSTMRKNTATFSAHAEETTNASERRTEGFKISASNHTATIQTVVVDYY